MSTEYSVSLSLRVQQALAALKQLTAQFAKVDKEVDDATDSLKKFEKELKDESATIKNTIAAQTAYVSKLKAMQAGLDKTSTKFRLVTAEIAKFERKLETGKGAITGFATALAGIGVGIALKQITGDIIGVGVALEGARAAVQTLAGEDFDNVQSQIKALVANSNNLTNATEANLAAYEALSAGVKTVDLSQVLEASQLLAAADAKGLTSQALAIDGLTTVMNAYGKTADEAAKITDQLVQTQADGKIVIGQYAANIGKVAPIAASLNVSLEEVNAALAASTIQGSQAEVAATGLRSALAKLAAPTKEGSDILAKYGANINAATLQSDGLIGALEQLKKVTNTEDLLKITGTEAGTTIQQLLADLDKFRELTERQTNANGVAQESADKLAESFAGVTKRLGNAVQSAKEGVWDDLKLSLGAVAGAVLGLVDAWNKLPSGLKTVIVTVTAVVGAIAGIATAIAAAVLAIKGLIAVFAAAKLAVLAWTGAATLAGAATTFLAGALAVLTAPITLIIAGVVALGLAFKAAYDNIEPFRDAVDGTIDVVKAAWAAVSAFVGAFTGSIFNDLEKEWNDLGAAVGKFWEDTVGVVGDLINHIQFEWKRAGDTITQVWGKVQTFFGNVVNQIRNTWNAAVEFIKERFRFVYDAVVVYLNLWKTAFQTVVDFFVGVWGDMVNELKYWWGKLTGWLAENWKQLFIGIAKTAINVLSPIAAVLSKLFGIDIDAALNSALEGALKGFSALGKAIDQGGDAAAKAWKAARSGSIRSGEGRREGC